MQVEATPLLTCIYFTRPFARLWQHKVSNRVNNIAAILGELWGQWLHFQQRPASHSPFCFLHIFTIEQRIQLMIQSLVFQSQSGLCARTWWWCARTWWWCARKCTYNLLTILLTYFVIFSSSIRWKLFKTCLWFSNDSHSCSIIKKTSQFYSIIKFGYGPEKHDNLPKGEQTPGYDTETHHNLPKCVQTPSNTSHSSFLTRSSSCSWWRNSETLTAFSFVISSSVLWRTNRGFPLHLNVTCLPEERRALQITITHVSNEHQTRYFATWRRESQINSSHKSLENDGSQWEIMVIQ
jgi:hypothetical protein